MKAVRGKGVVVELGGGKNQRQGSGEYHQLGSHGLAKLKD